MAGASEALSPLALNLVALWFCASLLSRRAKKEIETGRLKSVVRAAQRTSFATNECSLKPMLFFVTTPTTKKRGGILSRSPRGLSDTPECLLSTFCLHTSVSPAEVSHSVYLIPSGHREVFLKYACPPAVAASHRCVVYVQKPTPKKT